jgi:hypothetical protein
MAAKKGNWIAGATANKGGLHRSTGTPVGKPIPAAKVKSAASGKLGPKAAKQANLANLLGRLRPAK